VNLWLRFEPPGELFLKKLLYVSSTPWLYMFMCGMLVAANLQRINNLVSKWPWPAWIGLYATAMTLVGEYSVNASNAIHPLAFGLLGLIVLKAAFPPILKKGVATSFIQRNDLSYGLYLVHMPAINLLLHKNWSQQGWDIAMVIGTSMLLALGSWFCVERPALRHKI